MLTEKASLKQTQAQTQPQPQPQLQQTPTIVMVPTAVATSLPFNVQTDLNLYKKISIVKQYDYFRILHCCQNLIPDYIVYGEMPDGDKKILFTSSLHFECCRCCDEFTVWLGLCAYVCCDKILFQMDYKRNGVAFYTQGIKMQKGCYCCKCACCRYT